MAITLQTALKQTQKLAITQTMKQSLEMLQMSVLELEQTLQNELEKNPVLEELGSKNDNADERLDLLLSLGSDNISDNLDISFAERDDFFDDFEDKKQEMLENAVSTKISLYEHLISQVRVLFLPNDKINILEKIITSLDENGFFVHSKKDFAVQNAISMSDLGELLKIVYSLDPIGCGAVDLQETLLVQSKIKLPDEDILHAMLARYFNFVCELKWEKIAKDLDVPLSYVIQLSKLLQKLDPYPGKSFSSELSEPIIPEISVQLVDGEVVIHYIDGEMPELKINKYYLEILRKKNIDKNLQEYIKDRVDSARGLIKNIFDRKVTLIKVLRVVMENQKKFLEHGPGNLVPLNYQIISELCGYHESTISRVIANKYVETQWGIFSLRYFFTNRVAGNENSTLQDVLNLISDIVQSENPMSPKSDEDIVRILKNSSYDVARRTVAKYRDILKIPSSAKRKRINMIKAEETT